MHATNCRIVIFLVATAAVLFVLWLMTGFGLQNSSKSDAATFQAPSDVRIIAGYMPG